MPTTHANTADHPGRAHYEALRARFLDTKPLRSRVTTDLDRAGRVLIQADKLLTERDLRGTLALFPPSIFDASRLGDLARYGHALRYVAMMRANEIAAAPTRMVPAELAAEATEIRDRMLAVASHFFGKSEKHGKVIAAIAEGKGYDDLILDLPRLALLYETENAIVATDPVHYRATDAADAQRLAVALGEAMGTDARSEWSTAAVHAFSYAEREYWHLLQAIRFAFRERPEVADAFPSMFPRSGRRATNEESEGEIEPPAPPAPPVA